MFLQIVILLLGLLMVIGGANYLVDGASSVARKTGISEFVIGLVIVGFGTSLPELVVSITGAISRNSDIAVGNVIGSNIFNTSLILAFSAMIAPVAITRQNKFRDIPLTILLTFLVVFLGKYGGLSRLDGIVLVVLFAGYIFYSFRTDSIEGVEQEQSGKVLSSFLSWVMIAGGLAALIIGGRFFVHSAENLARMLGVSDKFIAITVLAMGTSLPEFITSIVALVKKRSQLALGNILGSNVFNLLLILGCSAIISPTSFARIDIYDYSALLLSIILVWTSVYTGKKNVLDRFDASLMLILFAAYMTKLFITL